MRYYIYLITKFNNLKRLFYMGGIFLSEEFKEGYKQGFADGYKEAMKEIFELQKEQMKNADEQAKKEMETPGVLPRPRPWPR